MAEQVVDRVQEKLATTFGCEAHRGCFTQEALEGAQTVRNVAGSQGSAVEEHLADAYGSQAARILAHAEENPSLAEQITPGQHYLMAEVPYAVQHEMALTLSDVLIRYTHVIHETRGGALPKARAVAELMASFLGWDDSEIDRQVSDYASQVALTQRWRGG
jgi:glycerol-3-phosphate dehydrogenase